MKEKVRIAGIGTVDKCDCCGKEYTTGVACWTVEGDRLDLCNTCLEEKYQDDDFKKSSIEKAYSKFLEEFSNDIIEEKVNWEDKDPGELKDETINALKVYHSKIAPMIRPLAVEQRRDVNIGDIHFMGFIDLELLGETADHKLKSRSMSQDDANKELQPYSYALLNGKREFTFHVAVKKKVPEIQLVHVSKTINDIEWFKNLIINIDKQINSGIFPPNPCGWWCGEKWCGYFSLCHSIGV